MADKRKAPEMLIDSVYNFLVSQGLNESAKALVKEGKVNEKKAKTADVPALVDVFTTYKRPNEATNGAAAKRAKVEDSTSDSESSSSEDEKPATKKPAAAAAAPNGKKAAPAAKKAESSDSDSSSSEDEKPVAKKAAAAAPASAAKKPVAKKAESSDSDSSSSSEDEKPATKKPAAAPAAKKPAAAAAKKAESDSDSSSSDSDSDDDKKKKTGVVATKGNTLVVSVPPKKAAPAKADSTSDSESSSSSESDSEDEKPAKKTAAAAKSTPAKAAAAAPATPSGGSSDVFKCVVKGLPWKTTEKELADFFKDCGKPNSCEIPLGDDGRSSGVGYVKFASRGELDAALALDGQYWPGTERWLKITEGVEKAGRQSFNAGVKPEGCDTVFVGNLPWDVDEDIMRNTFSSCGEITNVRFATAEDGSFKGFGHVQFADGDSTDAAVAMAGTNVNGRPIRVDFAPPRQRPEGGGGGRGGGGRGDRSPSFGGRGDRSPSFGGRGGGRGGAGGRGGRGGAPTFNKGKGTIAGAPGGKKMTFGDDE